MIVSQCQMLQDEHNNRKYWIKQPTNARKKLLKHLTNSLHRPKMKPPVSWFPSPYATKLQGDHSGKSKKPKYGTEKTPEKPRMTLMQ